LFLPSLRPGAVMQTAPGHCIYLNNGGSMIASRLTTGKALVGRSGLSAHGRYRRPRAARQPVEQSLDIFLIARRRAAEFGRVAFVISHWSSHHWNVVFADKFRPTPDDIIEYVA